MSVDSTRVRRPSRSFGWIDHRVLSGGYLALLDCTQIATYFTLCLVADRHGISFYRPESLARIIKRPTIAVVSALAELVRHQLIARGGRFVQVRDLDEIAQKMAGSTADPATPPPTLVPPPAPEPPAEAPETTLGRLAPADRERLLQKARGRFERFMGMRRPSAGALAAAAVGILREEEASCGTRP